MVLGRDQIAAEEQEIIKIIISLACIFGKDGIPLHQIDEEFKQYCGYSIPYKKFGADSLRSWLLTLPDVYIVQDNKGNEVLIEQSQKASHIKKLILRQKKKHQSTFQNNFRQSVKRKPYLYDNFDTKPCYYDNFDTTERPYKMENRFQVDNLPEGSYLRVVNDQSSTDSSRFEELETMLPLFYKHQALGDDFFLDIADTKLGYYVPENRQKKCGLCIAGQTISELTEGVKNALYLAPRVVVMIGFEDLLRGNSVSEMISDLRQLVIECKKRNLCVTLITLIDSPKLPRFQKMYKRMEVYNSAIMDYASDPFLQCNVIDMCTIFEMETTYHRNEFKKTAKKDPYKVFSDYGRKIFLSALRSCLKEQIEYTL